MLYEIVTGEFALRHMNPIQLTRYILSGKRPKISKVVPFLRGLIEACWSNDPEDRPSFSEIYDDLVDQRFRIFRDVDSDAVASYARSLS